LCDILSILSVHGVNMSKLESSPSSSGGDDFIFFLELDAGLREPGVASMLEELDRECAGLTLLGSYSAV
ncbi:MAG: bifunctional chorismate mutase/prephenate dehydratase, partial [Eubacteriales bacterium]|nr:bifunctional chorismate mutase/prephenate dehydratase [Eubacteriales bacterium]